MTGLFAFGILYAVVVRFTGGSAGFPAVAVIGLTAASALAFAIPLLTWRAGNWAARLGMKTACPACGRELAVSRRSCECGHQVRPSRDEWAWLSNRPAGGWPVRYAPLGYALSVAIVFVVDGVLLVTGNATTVLVSVAIVDVTLVGVGLALAGRSGPPQRWQFGLRGTSMALASRATITAYLGMIAATAVYYVVFGPFSAQTSSFAGNPESAGLIIAAVLFAPAAEEFFFRGFVYGTLRRRLPRHQAALVTTAMFVSAHWLSRYPLWALVPIGIFSIASCMVYERTGSIWPCMALHAANNASIFASPLIGGLAMCAIVAAMVALIQRSGTNSSSAPHWSLPAAAGLVCAVLLGIAGVFKTTTAPSAAGIQAPSGGHEAPGFSSAGETPATGTFAATGTVLSSVAYGNEYPGVTLQRVWTIARRCSDGTCVYLITRTIDGGYLGAELVPESDGWHVTFPAVPALCNPETTWYERSTFVIHFSDGGTVADAHERSYAQAPQCGYGTALLNWNATRTS